MTIFGFTPKVMAGSSISWESSVPFKHISLFLRVNKEGLCDGTKVSAIVFCDNLIFGIFGMEEKVKLTSLITGTLSFFKLDYLLFLIIYPYKLPGLTF